MKVDLKQVIVPEYRMRRDFESARICELAESVAKFGLQNPPVVRQSPEGQLVLVSGERRLRALQMLADQNIEFTCGLDVFEPGTIPVTLFAELDELHAQELELAENTIRVDLSWAERAKAIAKLQELRQSQNPQQTFKDTASEILGKPARGSEISSVSNAVILSRHLEDPDIAAAKSESEAIAILKRKLANNLSMALGTKESIKSRHTPILGSCLDVLPSIDAGLFDVIVADPPYGIGMDKMPTLTNSASGLVHEYEDSPELALGIYTCLAAEGYRVCANRAHAYLFCDFKFFPIVAQLFADAGWGVWPTPIIWYKPGGGMIGDYEHGPRRSYECILFANKGRRPVMVVAPDVIAMSSDQRSHAAQKPVGLYVDLLRRSVIPGSRVLDPCMGSGTIFPAANKLGCTATGIEISKVHFNTAISRQKETSDESE